MNTLQLMNVKDTYGRLGKMRGEAMTRSQIELFHPYLLHIHITKVGTRLFPEAYITGYTEYLRQHSLPVTTQSARDFAAGGKGVKLIEECRGDFKTHLSSLEMIAQQELAALFDITTRTLIAWCNKGMLSRKQRQGRHGITMIPIADVLACFTWVPPNLG